MSKPKERDKFFRLKFIGHCWALAEHDDVTLDDYVTHAKFRLCEARGYLMEDPIWDRYSDERILAEYFAMKCVRDEQFLRSFETQLPGTTSEDIADWMDQEIEKNKPAVEEYRRVTSKIEKQIDQGQFEFVPSNAKGN